MITEHYLRRGEGETRLFEVQALELVAQDLIWRSNTRTVPGHYEKIEYSLRAHPRVPVAEKVDAFLNGALAPSARRDRALALLEKVQQHVEHMEENLAGHTNTDVCVWLRQAIRLVKGEE